MSPPCTRLCPRVALPRVRKCPAHLKARQARRRGYCPDNAVTQAGPARGLPVGHCGGSARCAACERGGVASAARPRACRTTRNAPTTKKPSSVSRYSSCTGASRPSPRSPSAGPARACAANSASRPSPAPRAPGAAAAQGAGSAGPASSSPAPAAGAPAAAAGAGRALLHLLRPASGAQPAARGRAPDRRRRLAQRPPPGWQESIPAPQSASLHAQQPRHTCRRHRPPGCAARRASLRSRQAPRGCCSARGRAQASTTAARLRPGARGRRSVAGCGARHALHHANCCHAHAAPHRCRLLPAILQRLNVFADDHHLAQHQPSPLRVRGPARTRAQQLLQEVGEQLLLLLSYPASTSECRS